MKKVAVSKIKFFEKSEARLYIPQSAVGDENFPFRDGDLVKIEVSNPSIKLSRPEWWEMLDWNALQDTYQLLPPDVREKIRQQGLIQD
jgi:hypothetical protein